MILFAFLWSNQLINASNYKIISNLARLDWNWSSFENLIFMKKSNLISIQCWLILSKISLKSFQYIYTMHINQEKKKNGSSNPNLSSNFRALQANSNPYSSRFQSILRCQTHSLVSLQSIQTFTLPKSIQNREIPVWFVLKNLKFDYSYSCIINLFWLCFCD